MWLHEDHRWVHLPKLAPWGGLDAESGDNRGSQVPLQNAEKSRLSFLSHLVWEVLLW